MARTPGADARLMTRLRQADPAPLPSTGGLDERAEADLAAILTTPVLTAPPPRRRPAVLAAAAAVVVLGVGAVVTGVVRAGDDGDPGGPPFAAAGSPGGPVADAPAGAPRSTPGSPSDRAAAMAPAPDAQALLPAGGGVSYDHPVASSPAELATTAAVVLTGSVVGARQVTGTVACEGPGGPVPGGSEVVLGLDAVQVAQGQVGPGPVEVVARLGGEDALQRALPVGTRVLVYAEPGVAVDCSEVLRVTGPQGLAVQAAGAQVVWPMLGEVRDGDLSQALPGGSLIAP